MRTLVWGALPVVLLGGLLTVDKVPGTDIDLTVPYAAEGPGPTVNTLGDVDGTDVVEVHAPEVDDTAGNLNMTTVSVRSHMTLVQALGRWMFTDDTIVPIDTVIPPTMNDEEVKEANQQAFDQSESAATATALRYLHLPMRVAVGGTMEDTNADGVLQPDDIITHVDGESVSEPAEVQDLVRKKKPGDTVDLSVERDGKTRHEKVELGEHPDAHGREKTPLLGVLMKAVPADDIDVKYNLQDIGGPSAGMMFSLAVIDKLSPGELNAGKFVAGTGTIAEDGTVGPIGGIQDKVEAASEAGAELFLAPRDNCAEALRGKHGDMTIAAVDNIDDAVKAMDDFGRGKTPQLCE